MVGIADARGPVDVLACKLGIENCITFHGRIPSLHNLAELYQSAHVFIMLSENQPDGEVEGFGIAILEANYFGLPAIGSKGCGISDAIIDGYNGRLVEGNDPGAVRDALKDIMENFEKYSVHAKEWAKRHDWNRLVEYFLRNETPAFLNMPPTETAICR
jgi:phosphatidylinositol alpha-1,6-mannosyltransferase